MLTLFLRWNFRSFGNALCFDSYSVMITFDFILVCY